MELELSHKYEPLFRLLNGEFPQVDTVLITGGRFSQKSFGVGTWTCVAAKDYNHRVLYTRYTLTSAEDSIIPEFNEKIELLNAYNSFEVTRDRIRGIHNNSKIVFKGIRTSAGNQTASLKSLKDFSIFVVEEAEELPNFEDWDKVKKSIRVTDVRNLSILLLNPTSKIHWIYDEFYESRGVKDGFNGVVGNVMYIHTTYLDMPKKFIPQTIYDDFEDKRKAYEEWIKLPRDEQDNSPLKKKARYYKYTILGGWLEKSEGVIFENWQVGDFVETDNVIWGSDWGFSNDPTTLVKLSIDKSQNKIYLKEECYKTRMTTDDIATVMKRVCGAGLVIGDSAEPRLIEELSRRGINIKPAVKGQGSIKEGIALLLEYDLIVSPDSVNLIKELNNYSWNDKKSETPIDAHNHLLDAIRYAATHALTTKPREISFGW